MILGSDAIVSVKCVANSQEERLNFSKCERMLDILERYSTSLDRILEPDLNLTKRNNNDRTTT